MATRMGIHFKLLIVILDFALYIKSHLTLCPLDIWSYWTFCLLDILYNLTFYIYGHSVTVKVMGFGLSKLKSSQVVTYILKHNIN